MSIGILYESDEWSNRRLRDCIVLNGVEAEMIFMEDAELNNGGEWSHRMYVNRVFPSADMRGHTASISKTKHLLNCLESKGIPTVNSYEAFLYDCSKWKTYLILKDEGFTVPTTLRFGATNVDEISIKQMKYPLVVKRDCGGRSYDLQIIRTEEAWEDLKRTMARTEWILQEYIEPVKGYTTRIEVVGDSIITVLKRFIGKDAVSSYSAGSRYETYRNCPPEIIEDSMAVLKILNVEMGSLDFIENENEEACLIDVNTTSNFTPDYVPLLGFDPVDKMAEYILDKYSRIRK